jgi:hypothetical protein
VQASECAAGRDQALVRCTAHAAARVRPTCSSPMRLRSQIITRLSAPQLDRMVSCCGDHPICRGGAACSEGWCEWGVSKAWRVRGGGLPRRGV